MMTAAHHSLSKTCRAAFFVAPGRPLELRDVPVTRAGPHEALVRIECCTICGSDLHTISGGRESPAPSILGHEALGTIVELGDPPLSDIHDAPLALGDRVTWSPVVSCGVCDRCRSRLPQKCRALFKYGHAISSGPGMLNGGLAELIHLRAGSAVLKLAADAPRDVFTPVNCATATVAAAYRAAGPISGQRVLIFGSGMLGLTAAAFAKSAHAQSVTICDPNPLRLARAKKFGADRLIEWQSDVDGLRQQLSQSTDSEWFDRILDFSGSPAAVEASWQLADVGASVIFAGSVLPTAPIRLDPETVVRRLLTIRGVHNYVPDDLQTAAEFLQANHNRFPFAELVEQTFPLSRIHDAIQAALRDRPVRVAVHPGKER